MFKKFFVYIQYILPKHLLSVLMGWLATRRSPKFKNLFIQWFIKRYQVDMSAAKIENPNDYATFNDFFIRQLKPALRPIAKQEKEIASPVDGTIAQIGHAHQNQLIQAKNFYFDLETLLGGDQTLANLFYDGAFATFYLAPCDYHRIHMPLSGTLKKSIYVPGQLFSVNHLTADIIPNLYSRNERLILLFDTEAGPMVVILVGAILVGSIQTVWMQQPIRGHQILVETPKDLIKLEKGAELGHFKMGSTVILLYGKDKTRWTSSLEPGKKILFGQPLGNVVEKIS